MRIQRGMKRVGRHKKMGSETAAGGLQGPGLLRRGEVPEGPGRFRRRAGLACLVAAVVLLQCSRPVEVGQKAPEFSLPNLKGGSVSLSQLRGKVVFLHFWATWCPPCLIELPGLVRFVEGLQKGVEGPDKGQFVMLAVCVDSERPARIDEFMKSWGVDIPVYLDPGGSLARRFGTFRFPETYVLDHEGAVCSKVIGPGDWEMSKWARILHACAGKPDAVKRGVKEDS